MTKIKVVGVGGSGSNAISRMKKCNILGVELIAINTDAQDLAKSNADLKLRIGHRTTEGLGAGANPEIGRKSALENRADIINALNGIKGMEAIVIDRELSMAQDKLQFARNGSKRECPEHLFS